MFEQQGDSMRDLQPHKRLIVAVDLKPDDGAASLNDLRRRAESFMKKVASTGVVLKFNAVLRAIGYSLIETAHSHGIETFADLKLYDIKETLENDAAYLRLMRPSLVTVSANAGTTGMTALKNALPETEVLAITVLTSLSENEARFIHHQDIPSAVVLLGDSALQSGVNGVVCAPKEIHLLRNNASFDKMSIVTPGIRPAWSQVHNDDQNKDRIMTPGDAIAAGADRIVVGRPIMQAISPYDAIMRTIDEIANIKRR